MKPHVKLVTLATILSMFFVGCTVTQHWRLFRLDSLKPDSNGNYDLGQAWYGPVDTVDGWEAQLAVVALIAGWQGANIKTDTFGVVVRMMRVDSSSQAAFRVDTLTMTTLPDSVRFPLACSHNEIDTLNPRFRHIGFGIIKIPMNIDTILVDFEMTCVNDAEVQEKVLRYHRRLVRFDKAFHVNSLFAD